MPWHRYRVMHGIGCSQRGAVLVAVLWITAALAVLVTGMVWNVRVDTRASNHQYAAVKSRFLLDGGLRLAAAELSSTPLVSLAPLRLDYEIGGQHLSVDVVQSSGLINLNSANAELLFDLFRYAAALPEPQAQQLAQRVLDWRATKAPLLPVGTEAEITRAEVGQGQARHELFLHPDDVGQVPGLNPEIYARIESLIRVGRVEPSGVNPLAAPAQVLRVLAQGNEVQVRTIEQARASGIELSGSETIFVGLRHVLMSFGHECRLLAKLSDEKGRDWEREAWLSVARGESPWEWRYAKPMRRSLTAGGNDDK